MNVLFEGNTKTGKDEWLTPPSIIKSLGEFDLDPCSPINRPWDTALLHYTVNDDGLQKIWEGRVWCNPPYDYINNWLHRCANHGNAIALTFARTDTEAFHKYVFPFAHALFFVSKRIHFYDVNGQRGGSAGAPSVLIAYGRNNAIALQNCGLKGSYIPLQNNN
jgi:hypothetical protein